MANVAGFTFDLRATVGTPIEPKKEWLPRDAKDRFAKNEYFGVSAYLGGHASCLEITASRIFYVLNGFSFYEIETYIVSGVRILGWGARLAFFLTSVVFCFYSMTTTVNPIMHFSSFSRTRDTYNELTTNDDPLLAFTETVFYIWIISIGTLVLTYIIDRFGRTPNQGQCASFPLVLFNRSPIASGEGRCCAAAAVIGYFVGIGVAASLVLHTCIAHSYVARNREFMILLGILLACDVLGAIADAVSIGSVDGLRVTSSTVSWLTSFRVLIVVPLEIIFSVFFIWACMPDGL